MALITRSPCLTHRAGPAGTLSDLLRATAAAASSSSSLDGRGSPLLGGLSWASRVSLARGVAAGLAYLHGAGVAHGNVTPDNVLLLGAGAGAGQPFTPQLTDFGTRVLRAGAATAAPAGGGDDAASDAGSATSAASAGSGSGGAGGGTPYMYAAPECAAGGAIAAPCACDTYAFGAAILHALAHVGAGAAVGEFSSPLFRHLAAAAAAGSSGSGGGGHMAAAAAAGEESGQSDDAASYCCDWDPLQVHFARARAGWQPELAPRLPRALGAAVAACCAAAPPARPRMGDVRDALAGMQAEARGW
jgi:hypothetical protein